MFDLRYPSIIKLKSNIVCNDLPILLDLSMFSLEIVSRLSSSNLPSCVYSHQALTKKTQIEIHSHSNQRVDDINQALDDLESFALRAGDMADMDEGASSTVVHR